MDLDLHTLLLDLWLVSYSWPEPRRQPQRLEATNPIVNLAIWRRFAAGSRQDQCDSKGSLQPLVKFTETSYNTLKLLCFIIFTSLVDRGPAPSPRGGAVLRDHQSVLESRLCLPSKSESSAPRPCGKGRDSLRPGTQPEQKRHSLGRPWAG